MMHSKVLLLAQESCLGLRTGYLMSQTLTLVSPARHRLLSQVIQCRYAVAFRLPEGSANEGVYYELNDPPYVVQVSKAAAGRGLQLVVSGEEHDQGIPAEEYHDFYSRSAFPISSAEFWLTRSNVCLLTAIPQYLKTQVRNCKYCGHPAFREGFCHPA